MCCLHVSAQVVRGMLIPTTEEVCSALQYDLLGAQVRRDSCPAQWGLIASICESERVWFWRMHSEKAQACPKSAPWLRLARGLLGSFIQGLRLRAHTFELERA